MGGYINPKLPHDNKRPALRGEYHEHLASVAMVHNQNNLHQEQVEWADVVIIMHVPEWVEKNWDLFKRLKKRVIWRSIGQSTTATEQRLKKYKDEGLEVVRYSPYEERIPGNLGSDAIIRFYKDQDEFKGWEPKTDEVINFTQSMKSRGTFCNYNTFVEATRGFTAHIYGPNNEDSGELNGGLLEYNTMKQKMRDARVYLYTGTHPACYTLNFIEAFMTGIPIVAVGNQRGNNPDFNQDTYEVADLLKNGMYGFASDSIEELTMYIQKLITDPDMAKRVSRQARTKAIELFGMDTVLNDWKRYLEK